jgi:DNA polymerase I
MDVRNIEASMKCDALIVDGRHALWRTSDAFKMLSAEVNGETIGTGGMYGFLCLMTRIHQKYGGKITVAWEGKNNFRHEVYPEYKKRAPMDAEQAAIVEDMRSQEKRLMAMLRLLGVEQFYGSGCEADDVVGRLSKEYRDQGDFVIIYSGDSDLRQLVDETVWVASPGYGGSKDTLYDQQKVRDRHGVVPGYISDLKALAGDSSDNIPGIKGIGPKYATSLINAYGDVENIIAAAKGKSNTAWPISERHRDGILLNVDDLRMYKKLTTVYRDMPMKEIKIKPDKSMLIKHFQAYHFTSLLATGEMHELLSLTRPRGD